MSMKRFLKWPYIIPVVLVLAPIVASLVVLVFGGIVMLLWNWLLPRLFGWPELTLVQAFGLLVLCRLLFGGFGGGGGGGHSKNMSPEDRERFRRRMSAEFCRSPGEGSDTPPVTDAPGRSDNPGHVP